MSTTTPQPPQIAPLAEGLVSRSFPTALDDSGTPDAATAAFNRGLEYGFYEPWYSDEQLERAVATYAADGQICTGVYVDLGFASLESWGDVYETVGFDSAVPVGTFVDSDQDINAGGLEPVPARLITGVTVNPSFRRRGILKHMMTARLADAVEAGLPLAALTVSEGSIYGRFGFGAATREQQLEVNTGLAWETFALRTPPTGKVLTVDPSKLEETMRGVFGRFHRKTRGSVARQSTYWKIGSAQWDPENITSWWRKARAVVHVRDDGEIGGYAVFSFDGWEKRPLTMTIRDLVAVDGTSRIELYRHLASMDIVERVVENSAPVQDPLAYALVNPRARRVVRDRDVVWVRILDVARSLTGRQWGGDGQFVLELTDPLGITSGRYGVVVRDGVAEVTEGVLDGPRLSTDVETLSSLYLGDATVHTLVAAGRIQTDDAAALSRIFDLPLPPYSVTNF